MPMPLANPLGVFIPIWLSTATPKSKRPIIQNERLAHFRNQPDLFRIRVGNHSVPTAQNLDSRSCWSYRGSVVSNHFNQFSKVTNQNFRRDFLACPAPVLRVELLVHRAIVGRPPGVHFSQGISFLLDFRPD
jgi:hypothetical protein